MFSYVVDKEKGLLNEADSWKYFKNYMRNKTLTKFEDAYNKIKNRFERVRDILAGAIQLFCFSLRPSYFMLF